MPFDFLKIFLLSVIVAACAAKGHPAAPPTITSVAPREGNVVIEWTSAEEGAEHWLFYAPSDGTFTKENWSDTPGAHVIMKVTSPYTLSGLTNDTQYAFFLNARVDGGPGGASTPTATATPRLAGGEWTASTTISGTPNLNAITYGGRFVAVGASWAIYSSSDGMSWSTATVPDFTVNGGFNAISYGGGFYVALGYDTTHSKVVSATSVDGQTWVADTAAMPDPAIATPMRAMTSFGSYFVAVGNGGKILRRDGDPKWSDLTSPAGGENLVGLAYANVTYTVNDVSHTGRFVAVGAKGTIIVSTEETGATWEADVDVNRTADFNAVACGAGLCVAVANGEVWSSSNGLSWNTVDTLLNGTSASLGNLTAIVYGTQFIATDGAGKVYTSKDGSNWLTANTTTVYANAIARGDNHYVAVGNGGTSWTSYWTGP